MELFTDDDTYINISRAASQHHQILDKKNVAKN